MFILRHSTIQEQQEHGPLKISTTLRTQTQLDTGNTYIDNIHNK